MKCFLLLFVISTLYPQISMSSRKYGRKFTMFCQEVFFVIITPGNCKHSDIDTVATHILHNSAFDLNCNVIAYYFGK